MESHPLVRLSYTFQCVPWGGIVGSKNRPSSAFPATSGQFSKRSYIIFTFFHNHFRYSVAQAGLTM